VVGGIWLFIRQTTEFISWARRFSILLIFWLNATIPIDRIAARSDLACNRRASTIVNIEMMNNVVKSKIQVEGHEFSLRWQT
jgi:hypothetical protein